jgi:hypothetical protein
MMFGKSQATKEQEQLDKLVALEIDLRSRMDRNERGARERYVEAIPAHLRLTTVVPTKEEQDLCNAQCYPSDTNEDGTSLITDDWTHTLEARRSAWEARFPGITKWRHVDPNSGGDAAGASNTTAPAREAALRGFSVDPSSNSAGDTPVEILWRAPRLRLEREGDEIRLVFVQPNPQHADHWAQQLLACCRKGIIHMSLEAERV